MEWCEENEDGGPRTDEQGNEYYMDKAQTRARRKQAEAIINKAAPARLKYLDTYRKADQVARTVYPGLYKADDSASKYAMGIITEGPQIALIPDHVLVLGDAHVGHLIRTGQANAVLDEKTGMVKIIPITKAKSTTPSKDAPAKVTKPPVTPKAAPPPVRSASSQPTMEAAVAAKDMDAAMDALFAKAS